MVLRCLFFDVSYDPVTLSDELCQLVKAAIWSSDSVRETRVLILELYRNPAFYDSQAYKHTHRFWGLIGRTVEEGRKSGFCRTDFRTETYLHLIQGTFEHEALARMMLPRRKATPTNTEQTISLLLRTIKA